MPNPLQNAHVALGVTGSIACYKAVDLASKLTQRGALVDVIMTRGATSFLAPLTFRGITHREVVTNVFDPSSELSMDHVAIAQRADVVLIAPATANTIAKLADGAAWSSSGHTAPSARTRSTQSSQVSSSAMPI